MSNFTHIHLHTDFSLLDGYGRCDEYAKKASANEVKYLCITDHGMAAAIPQMIEQSRKYNLKPVFGSEVYVNNYQHLVPNFKNLSEEEKFFARKNYHLVLLAKNEKGYENLIKLVSEGWISGFYYKPRVSWELIKKHSEGLCCSSACLGSELSQLVLQERTQEAEKIAREFKETWPDDYYIELQMINLEEQDKVNKGLLKIADKLSIPLVLTNDVHYCEEKESYNQMINLLLNSKGTINKREGLEFHTDQLWYKTEEELDYLWEKKYKNDIPESEYQEAKLNTIRICEKCNVKIDTSPKFPEIPDADLLVKNYCFESMKKRGFIQDKVYKERLLKEYKLINEKGFMSYFMCVKKIIDWTKSQGYTVGAGRGSGGGSLICYLLGITGMDPIKHDLLFERFLSPSRGGRFAKLQFNPSSEIK